MNKLSSDYIIAGYINKIQYVAFQMMVAKHLDYKVGKFCHFVQNLHIYDRHFDAAEEILNKTPKESDFPYITLNNKKDFYDYNLNDFEIHNIEGITKIKSNLEISI